MKTMSETMLRMLSELEQDCLVDLWDLDLRGLGGELLHFCNLQSEMGDFVVWKSVKYQSYPFKVEGIELTGQGASNRPKLTVSNVLGLMTGLVEQHHQLVGAVLVRHQTYARFLDAANFQAGNPQADKTQEVVSKYIIEQLSSLTPQAATFELAAPSESEGSVAPARMMLANVCCWQYRGVECGYTGKPVADRMDRPTSDPKADRCSGTLLGCQARFGGTAALPFGGFISIDKVLK